MVPLRKSVIAGAGAQWAGRARAVIAVLSAGAAMSFLTVAAVNGVNRIQSLEHPHYVPLSASVNDVRNCVSPELHRRVPDGSTIALAPMAERYAQRITEWAAPSIRVVASPAEADYVVRLRHLESVKECDGFFIKVWPT